MHYEFKILRLVVAAGQGRVNVPRYWLNYRGYFYGVAAVWTNNIDVAWGGSVR